jgi:Xaa-Pro aminopeptidase
MRPGHALARPEVRDYRAAAGLAFTPIAASGSNTVAQHYEANNRRMQAGDVVLLDFGADYDYYTSDVTRTWPVSGRFSPEQEKMYRCVLEASKTIIAMMKPGVTITQMRQAALDVYRRHGFDKQFEADGRYVGHYVGMSVHDVNPGADVPLQAGATFNVEPLLTLNDQMIHVRLEDTILVTPNGAENLTKDVPVEIDEIYALIRQKGIGQ